MLMKKWLKELRVTHYLKNFVLFLPLFFNGSLFNVLYWKNLILGFVAFSATASVIYLINDIQDKEKDARHPVKRYRPIASGEISIFAAYIAVVALTVVAMGVSIVLFLDVQNSYGTLIILLVYFAINIGYSVFGWKNIPVWDVVLLASGYYLRLLYGAVITGITLSEWLSLVVITGSFFMGFGKRRNELKEIENETRGVLKRYSYAFCNNCVYCCMTLVIVFFSFWCLEKNVNGRSFVLLIPLFIIWCFKYVYNLESEQSDGDPMNLLLNDKGLIIYSGIMMLVFVAFLYI